MNRIFTLKINHMFKKSVVCATMLGLVVFALASSGGGKKKTSSSNLGIIPIRANGVLNDKTRPGYTGSHFFKAVHKQNATVYRSVVTYQKGNTTYIVPSRYRLSNQGKLSFRSAGLNSKSNLNLVDLKIRLCK